MRYLPSRGTNLVARRVATLSAATMLLMSLDAAASYLRFCELTGEVVSSPSHAGTIDFQFLVSNARDIDPEPDIRNDSDCAGLVGTRLAVVLGADVAGDPATIVKGSIITLERYDMDVMDRSGGVFRSVRYVRPTSDSADER